jgi:Uma2 family endonuclease
MMEGAMAVGPLMTVDDLALLPDDGNRYELIEGELLVSHAPGLTHQHVFGNLFGALWQYFAQYPIGEVVATPGIIFDRYNGVIPDVVVVLNERRDAITAGERFVGPPNIVIEIVSPGAENTRRDRIMKRQIYGKFGVNEYWVVDPAERTVEIYRPHAGTLELDVTLAAGDMLRSPVLPEFACSVDQLFKR